MDLCERARAAPRVRAWPAVSHGRRCARGRFARRRSRGGPGTRSPSPGRSRVRTPAAAAPPAGLRGSGTAGTACRSPRLPPRRSGRGWRPSRGAAGSSPLPRGDARGWRRRPCARARRGDPAPVAGMPSSSTGRCYPAASPFPRRPSGRIPPYSRGGAAAYRRHRLDTGSCHARRTRVHPDDDLSRELTIARPDTDQSLTHIGLVGDTYTILVSGEDTAGRYTLIDMHVPPNGGPPPHRHDFEEMFTVLDGEVRRPSAARPWSCGPARRSTCPRTLRTRSPTPGPLRRGCCACARRRARRSSSPWSGSPSPPGPNRLHRSTRRPRGLPRQGGSLGAAFRHRAVAAARCRIVTGGVERA